MRGTAAHTGGGALASPCTPPPPPPGAASLTAVKTEARSSARILCSTAARTAARSDRAVHARGPRSGGVREKGEVARGSTACQRKRVAHRPSTRAFASPAPSAPRSRQARHSSRRLPRSALCPRRRCTAGRGEGRGKGERMLARGSADVRGSFYPPLALPRRAAGESSLSRAGARPAAAAAAANGHFVRGGDRAEPSGGISAAGRTRTP